MKSKTIEGTSPFILPPSRGCKPQLKKPRLELIRQEIPLIKNLHFSFWQNPQFLRWQLVRLNKDYQSNVENIWEEFWLWLECEYKGCEESIRGWRRKIAQYGFEDMHNDYPPLPNETFDEWNKRPRSTKKDQLLSQGFFETKTFDNPPHADLVTIDFIPGFNYFLTDKEGKRKLITPGDLELMEPPPIPWVVRFPSPFLLNKLPPWPEKGKSIKGRPQNWARNLLVYELSQAGMKNMQIARLLFGVDKSTEYRPDNPKHPILVKIAKAKKAMKKIVVESFPL